MASTKKADWKFYLFGGLRMERDGRDVDPPPYRYHDVLAYLLLNHEKTIRRDRLMGEVFPDLHIDRARARLSDHLWLIKSSFPGLVTESTRDEIRLESGTIWLDCLEFSKLTVKADGKSFLKGMELYKDDLLPQLYSDWIFPFRERYRNQYLNSLRKLAQQYYEKRQYVQAGEILRQLVDEEPFDELAVRQLMITHVQSGRRGLAISTYETYRLLCMEQINVQPENETQVLYEAIVTRAVMPKPSMEIRELDGGKPGELIRNASEALNAGNHSELLEIIQALSSLTRPDLILQRDLLHMDESIQWADYSRAWRLLDSIQQRNEQTELRRAILLIERNDIAGAEQVLIQVLKTAMDRQNRDLEANALLHISEIKAHRAEFQDALLAVNRSIQVAIQINQPALTAKAYLQKARILYQQGANHDVRDVLLHAQSLAQNHHFKWLLAEIDLLFGNSFQRNGLYLSAYKVIHQALELARDTGMNNLEARALLGLAAACDFLGRNAESIQALETARNIYTSLKDETGLAQVDYNLAAALPYHDENRCDEAIRYAWSALEVFMKKDLKSWQAVTHTALAFAMWINGQNQNAILHYQKSMDLHKALGENGFIPELCAYIGLAHLGLGDYNNALQWTDRALQEQAMLNLSDIVTDIYYARGAALETSGNAQVAVHYYERAYQTLLDYAKDIGEEDARRAYFHRDPITRRLMQKMYELNLAPKARHISLRHDAMGRPAKRQEIILTIHAGPSDEALAQTRGSTATRQAQLERMLKQANRQHAKLSLEELARVFKVSKRTIQRDLAAINSQNNIPVE